MKKIKILEWNINMRSGVGRLDYIPKLVIDEIKKEQVDVIFLSEFVVQKNNLAFSNELEKLGYNLFFDTNNPKNQILIGIKDESIDIDNMAVFSNEVFGNNKETPNFLHLMLKSHGETINLIGTRIKIASPSKHFSYAEKLNFQINEAKERNEQVDSLINYLDEIKGTILVTGDFNNFFYDNNSNTKSWAFDHQYLQNYFSFPLIEHKMLEHGFNAYTPDGYSWINRNLKSSPKRFIKNDHVFSNSLVSDVSYSWDFKENPDYEDVVGYPDHAKLIATVGI